MHYFTEINLGGKNQWPNNDHINIGLANIDLKTDHSQFLRWASWLQNIMLPIMGLFINTSLWLLSTFKAKYIFSLIDALFNELLDLVFLNAEGGVSPSQDVTVAMRIYPIVNSS